jgi:FG-GAP-like repeat
VFGDIDRDGNVDVVTALATNGRKLLIQWAPDASLYMDRAKWESGELDPSSRRNWNRAEVADFDGENFEDIVAGSQNGGLFVYLSPASPRDTAAWSKLTITTSLARLKDIAVTDMDGDGDLDIVVTDRATLAWFENPKPNLASGWIRYQVEDLKDLGNLMTVADVDQDGLVDLIVADNRHAADGRVAVWYRRLDSTGLHWTKYPVFVRGGRPFRGGPNESKGVAVGDVDGDGKNDIVLNVNATTGYKVYWLSADVPTARRWTTHPISTEGQKYDNIDLVDIDRDGDLDVVTSEEVKRLGVIWFENP